MKEATESAGARQAFINLLRLPGNVAPYFEQELRAALPARSDRILNRIREVRGGRLNRSEFGERMRGHGPYWEMIVQLFELHCRRLGFNQSEPGARARTFRRPSAQRSLFE